MRVLPVYHDLRRRRLAFGRPGEVVLTRAMARRSPMDHMWLLCGEGL